MKEKPVYCEAVKANIIKSARCPEYDCKTCPELKTPKAKTKATPNKRGKARQVNTDIEDSFGPFPIYTKHPPIKELDNSTGTSFEDAHREIETKSGLFPDIKDEIGLPLYLLLQSKRNNFRETKNPVYAIEAFVIAHINNLYPPLWVLDHLAMIFTEWHKSNGKKSIDELFKIKSKGKGKRTHPFEALLIEQRNEMLCYDIFRLNFLFDISIEDAAIMVATRLKETPEWDTSGWDLQPVEPSSLERYYLKGKYGKISAISG